MAEEPSKGEVEEKAEEKVIEAVEERVYTIPLGKVYRVPFPIRTPRAIREIRRFIQRHMKSEEVKIDGKLNEYVWRRSIEKPPRRVRVKAAKDKDGVVWVFLAEKG
ncbi:MAG: 50S ribosomal protein L31e [Candidatus Hecatellaceae archaeon]